MGWLRLKWQKNQRRHLVQIKKQQSKLCNQHIGMLLSRYHTFFNVSFCHSQELVWLYSKLKWEADGFLSFSSLRLKKYFFKETDVTKISSKLNRAKFAIKDFGGSRRQTYYYRQRVVVQEVWSSFLSFYPAAMQMRTSFLKWYQNFDNHFVVQY